MLVRLLWLVGVISAATLDFPSQAPQVSADVVADAILLRRAQPAAPDGYIPRPVDCPSPRPSIRIASGLSPDETSWLQTRRLAIQQPMKDLLNHMAIPGVDVNAVTSNLSALPVISLAVSGGGYRSLLTGAGVVAALDSRTPGSTTNGSLGGLLQASTYFAGLSGGSWLLGTMYVNNFTAISSLLDATPDDSGSLWQFQNSIFTGPASAARHPIDAAQYYTSLYSTVQGKRDAGFNTTITDYWGRALSYQLLNATNGGPSLTWSSIATDPGFSSGSIPMPIVVTDSRSPGQLIIASNSTIFEFTPWEMGSFDATLYGFAPLKYVGSNFSGGSLASDQQCIAGFDSASYIMGSSSTLFNQFFLQLDNQTYVPKLLRDAIGVVLGDIDGKEDDIAQWTPSPFFNYQPPNGQQSHSKQLTLVDGGEDLQNIPLHPLIQPERNVDVIFAVDSSADTADGFPDGLSLRATYDRSLLLPKSPAFPAIPDNNTFINLGLNRRPTWFGCDLYNYTSSRAPLIVYLPNTPYSAFSNVTTFDPSYNISQRNAIVQNGFNMATMGNSTVDPSWSTCAGCAVLLRHYQYSNLTMPDACKMCMSRFCWNGTIASTPVIAHPTGLILDANSTFTAEDTPTPSSQKSIANSLGVGHGIECLLPALVVLILLRV